MRSFLPALAAAALQACVLAPAYGRIGVPISLPGLCERSDLVVVGRARSVRDVGTATPTYQGHVYAGRLMGVELVVERTLKGTPDSDVLSFTYAITGFGEAVVNADQFGVFFLRPSGGGYGVVDPDS